MGINYSLNKIRVVKILKSDSTMGLMDPVVGMITNYGKILGLDSGNNQVTVGVGKFALQGSGTVKQKFYPHQLEITYAAATGTYGFPATAGSVRLGHKNSYPSGIQIPAATGMAELWGDSNIHTFNRPSNIID